MDTYVLYHDKCIDGYTSAWVTERALVNQGRQPTLMAVDYKSEPKKDIGRFEGSDLYLVDISFPVETLRVLAEHANSITLIDHHKHRMEEIIQALQDENPIENLKVCYDPNKCGASLCWNFFTGENESLPYFIRVVEDWDVHRLELPNTTEYIDWILSFPMTLNNWDYILKKLEDDRERVLVEAKAISRRVDTDVERNIDAYVQMLELEFKGEEFKEYQVEIDHTDLMNNRKIGLDSGGGGFFYEESYFGVSIGIPCVQSSHILVTRTCKALKNRYPESPFVSAFSFTEKGLYISLRSYKDTDYDVSAVARAYGGGGHRNAAAFVVPHGEFLFIENEILLLYRNLG